VYTLTGHSGDVVSIAFSRDGKRIVSGSRDNLVKIWDTETGLEVSSFVECVRCGGAMRVFCSRFSLGWLCHWSEEKVGGRCAS
jgi:WD40 repeat protein